jgi:hypothetical protein
MNRRATMELEEQSIAAQHEAWKAGLPPLRGTPKQIAWGETNMSNSENNYDREQLCDTEICLSIAVRGDRLSKMQPFVVGWPEGFWPDLFFLRELAALNPSSFDLDTRTVTVAAAYTKGQGHGGITTE